MGAGLEADDKRRPARLVAGRVQRVQLGVRPTELGVPAFGDHFVATQDDRAHEGIRGDAAPPAPRELEGAAHRVQLSISIFLQTEPSQRSHAPAGFRR